MFKKSIYTIALTCVTSLASYAQCEDFASQCMSLIPDEYILDGQEYRALLINDETAEFAATFYGNSTYRIAGCNNDNEGGLEFSLVDKENNILFSNKNFDDSPFWDFKFNSTVTLRVQAQLADDDVYSGCAVMLIGFKP